MEVEVSQIDKLLTELRYDLEQYFGKRNELQKRLTKEIPKKPGALVVYEFIKSTGIPLVEGGLIDQPHIWLLQYEVVDGVVKLFDHIEAINNAQNQK